MKHLLLTTIAAVLLVGCGKPSNPEADRALFEAARNGNNEAAKQHLDAGADVNAAFASPSANGVTPLHLAAASNNRKLVELLIAKGANVNVKDENGRTPLYYAIARKNPKTADLLRKHGGKTGKELEAEGN